MLLENTKTSERLTESREILKTFMNNFNNGTIKSFISGAGEALDGVRIRHTTPTGAEYGISPIVPRESHVAILFRDQSEIIELEVQVVEKGGKIILLLHEKPALQEHTESVTYGLEELRKKLAVRLKEVLGGEEASQQSTLECVERRLRQLRQEDYIDYVKRKNFSADNSVIKFFYD